MPTKARRSPQKTQSRKSRSPIKGKGREKLIKARERELKKLDRDYRRKLRALEQTGYYKPKAKIGKKLTAANKKAIAKRYREFEEFLNKDAYIYVPIPTRSKKKRDAALKLAKQNKMVTSPKGVFVPKTKYTTGAQIVLNKKTGTYRIKVKKTKKGATGKKQITEILPIEPLISIEDELERVKSDAEMLKLQKGEALAYRVTLNDEGGFSWNIFQTPEQLRSFLNQGVSSANYGTPASRLQIYRSVSVMKVKRTSYFKEHPRRVINPYYTNVDKTGRSIKKTPRNPRSKYMTPWEQGYAAYNSGFTLEDNPYPVPPERRQWANGWLQARKDDGG